MRVMYCVSGSSGYRKTKYGQSNHILPYLFFLECGCLRVFIYQLVEVNFPQFNLEQHANCVYDKVQIYDGHTRNATLLAEYCGSNLPHDIISTSNELLIIFTSDHDVTGGGFLVEFSSVTIPKST